MTSGQNAGTELMRKFKKCQTYSSSGQVFVLFWSVGLFSHVGQLQIWIPEYTILCMFVKFE